MLLHDIKAFFCPRKFFHFYHQSITSRVHEWNHLFHFVSTKGGTQGVTDPPQSSLHLQQDLAFCHRVLETSP